MEKREFQTESKRLLDLMINSVYTNKEIFLRELISNASDAIDKLYYLSVTDGNIDVKQEDFNITLTIDKEARTLTISDNGIGMNYDELNENLGIIANSGSRKFKEQMDKEATAADIIGQFGVGFYSAFMVADKVTVITKKYNETQAYRWESDGMNGYSIEETEKEAYGTDIILYIRRDAAADEKDAEKANAVSGADGTEASKSAEASKNEEEMNDKDEYSRYLREYPLFKLIKKYSDYVHYPIRMLMPHPELKEGSTQENPEYEEKYEYETLNSMRPLWQRSKSEITKEEYNEFYKNTYEDQLDPQRVIHLSIEGNISYKALIYIPAVQSRQYDTEDFKSGLTLYSSGVKIIDHCEALLPDYFNFIRGIVDSPDVSLNISREMLQQDGQLKLIASNIEKKIRAELEKMLRDEREEYEKFYKNFGRRIKVCALDDYGAKKDILQDLLLFWSSKEGKLVTLQEYVDKMVEGQKYIYYASGNSIEALDHLPQTETLKDHKMDILYFTDKADEFITDMFRKYKGTPFRSAVDGELGIEGEKDETDSYPESFEFIKSALAGKVDEVKASSKLKSHPVCLSSGTGITFEMEKYFKAVQPNMPMKAKRILEINTKHPAFMAYDMARIIDPEKAKKYCEIFYNQACMIAGLPVEDPSAYTDLLVSLWS